MAAKKKMLRLRKKKSHAELLRLEIKSLVHAIWQNPPTQTKIKVDTASLESVLEKIMCQQDNKLININEISGFMKEQKRCTDTFIFEQKQLTIGIQQALNTLCDKIEMIATKGVKK